MIISFFFQILSRTTVMARAGLVMLLLSTTGIAQALDTEVDIFAVNPTANERGPVAGQFLIRRNDPNNSTSVTVTFSVSGRAFYTTDYTTSDFSGTSGSGTTTGLVTFLQGQSEKIITITPVNDFIIERPENISIDLDSSVNYQLGSHSSAEVIIADDDQVARVTRPDTLATEDTIDGSLNLDPDFGRRAIFRIAWAPDTGVTPATQARSIRVTFRNPTPSVSGVATLDTDYEVHHKIIGSNSSYIGGISTATETTGLGVKVYGHLRGETVIQVVGGSAAIPLSAQVRFGDSLITYSVSASNTTNGIGTITLSTPLLQNIANTDSVTVLGTAAPTGYTINVPYPAGTSQMKVVGELFVGDVFRVGSEEKNHYVVISSTATNAFGGRDIVFYRYLFDGEDLLGGGGLGKPIEGETELKTFFSTPLVGNVATIDLPAESDRIEFSIAPKRTVDGVEGAETVTMTLSTSTFYRIADPLTSTVTIADIDSTASITRVSDAQRPSTSGKFRVNFLGGQFPTDKEVRIYYTTSGTATEGGDYQSLPPKHFAVLPSGSSSVDIDIQPIDPPPTPGQKTVTLTLLDSNDFILSGSPGSGNNASATLNIGDSAGVVSISASLIDAQEATPPVTSFFTVNIVRPPPGTGPVVSVNYLVSGAAPARRYAALGQIQLTGNSTTLTVTPVDDSIADGNQDVKVTLLPGNGYSLGTTISGSVNIIDNEATVSVSGSANAVKGGTDGFFSITGTTLPVYFELTGTAVLNIDFSSNATITKSTQPYRGYISSGANVTITGTETSNDSADKNLTLTILDDDSYNINDAAKSRTITITAAPDPNAGKPTPGSVNSGASSGGCGLGSGFATLLGFAGFALLAIRLRRLG